MGKVMRGIYLTARMGQNAFSFYALGLLKRKMLVYISPRGAAHAAKNLE